MRLPRILLAAVGLSLAVPGTAYAVSVEYSKSGADYSKNTSSGYGLYACDEESDGHPVRVDWQEMGSSYINDYLQTSGSGTCGYVGLANLVYKHRIVEVIPYSTDDYGNWAYPN